MQKILYRRGKSFYSTSPTKSEAIYAKLARQLLDKYGLVHWTFNFNMLRTSLGVCFYKQKRIELSVYHVNNSSHADIVDTLLHECSHSLAGYKAGHGPIWRAMCRKLGAKPERCGKSPNVVNTAKYIASCGNCKRSFAKHRKPSGGFAAQCYYCPKCGPKAGKINFKENYK